MKILQVPDGMKRKVLKIADGIEDAIIDCESCFGACDIAVGEAKALGCDGVVHYGHSKFLDSDLPVEYVEFREDYDPTPVLKSNLEMIKEKRIGLVSTLQFLDSLLKASRFLNENCKVAVVGKGKHKPGQILGCDTSSVKSIENEVDAFLYIGSGRFHPLGLSLQTEKPVYSLDVERGEISLLGDEKNKLLKQRYVAIGLARDANVFGILVSVKPGQMNLELAKSIKKRLEAKGKKAYILIFNEIRPEKLLGMEIDCYINTACPRIAIDDRTSFKKPILNPDEIESFI